MPFAVGDLIDGHYRVEQRFAGGMGFVYIVLDEIVGKRFAIKQLSELHAESDILRERFRREASTWLLLDYHPHIVQAHSYLPRADAPMLILEYVDGPSVDRLLRAEKRLCNPQVITYAQQFCRGMRHAHARVIPDRGLGVLHRDIKPGNLLLTRTNQLKVTDFGLAKIHGDPNLTSEGQFVGTVAYSSPEQLRGASDVTKASDVYSFGAVMYQMLTGHQPFRGANPAELYHAVNESAPKPIAEINPDADPALVAIITRCLQKSADDRYSDFHQLEAAINQLNPLGETRAIPCSNCGFISARSLTKCSVCGNALANARSNSGSKAARKSKQQSWQCSCGASVPATRAKCDCGNRRPEEPIRTTEPDSSWPRLSDHALPVPGLSDSTPACRIDQRSNWSLDAAKEYLVELKSDGELQPWLLERAGYTLGRAENMKIRIEDSTIARYQLFLVRLPCGWLAMNPQLNPGLRVNGWTMRQRVLRPGDLLHVGASWLAFAGPNGISEPLPPIPGHWPERIEPTGLTVGGRGSHSTTLDAPPPTACTLEFAGNRSFVSRGQPLRIGSSPLCEVRLEQVNVAPIHALVTWQLDGPHLVNIAGPAVRRVGGGSTESDQLLRDGDIFEIAGLPMRARVEGDLLIPGQRWAEATAPPGRFSLTVLNGPQRGQTAVLPTGQPITLGRHSECDVVLAADAFISRRHVQLTAGEGAIDMKDLQSRAGFFVNQTHFTTTAVGHLGDVLVLGKTSLLIHHEMDAE